MEVAQAQEARPFKQATAILTTSVGFQEPAPQEPEAFLVDNRAFKARGFNGNPGHVLMGSVLQV